MPVSEADRVWLFANEVEDGDGDIGVEEKDLSGAREHNVIPLLLFSCNRPTVNRFLHK